MILCSTTSFVTRDPGEGSLTRYFNLRALCSGHVTNARSRELIVSWDSLRSVVKKFTRIKLSTVSGNALVHHSTYPILVYGRKGTCKTLIFISLHTSADQLHISSIFPDYLMSRGRASRHPSWPCQATCAWPCEPDTSYCFIVRPVLPAGVKNDTLRTIHKTGKIHLHQTYPPSLWHPSITSQIALPLVSTSTNQGEFE